MKNFYFTFMQKQTDLKNGFVKVTAKNEPIARDLMHHFYGSEWAFCYREEEFCGQPEKYNLHKIDEINQRDVMPVKNRHFAFACRHLIFHRKQHDNCTEDHIWSAVNGLSDAFHASPHDESYVFSLLKDRLIPKGK